MVTANEQAKLVYAFNASDQPTSVTAQCKDGGGSWQTLATLTFNFACTRALFCITLPYAQQCKYICASFSSFNLTTFFNCTLNLLQLFYTRFLPTSIQYSYYLYPTHSFSFYLTFHSISVSYYSPLFSLRSATRCVIASLLRLLSLFAVRSPTTAAHLQRVAVHVPHTVILILPSLR